MSDEGREEIVPFAALGLPISLQLSSDEIESAWRERARAEHPDSDFEGNSPSDTATSQLNTARQLLLDPAERLAQWLIEKTGSAKTSSSLDEEMMSFFTSVNTSLQKADSLILKKKGASTALAKALLTKEAIASQMAIQETLQNIQSQRAMLISQFPDWERAAENGEFADAESSFGKMRFLKKWESESQKRLIDLISD